MLSMLALGALVHTSPPLRVTSRPFPHPSAQRSSESKESTTELGGVIHFPSKLSEPGWPEAEAALDRLKATLGAGAYVRWDALWHESNWEPNRPYGYDRLRHVVGLLARRDLRSLVVLIPHPWPGSGWDGGPTSRDWGAPKPEWFPTIALRYREAVDAYRGALRDNGMSEASNAVQWGNEPASGHPGGDGTLARGTWSGHALWTELNRDPSFYGALQVISPALSMLDESSGTLEVNTSAIRAGLDWTGPVDRRAMHFRFYRPQASDPSMYAQEYIVELGRRSAAVQTLPWPQGSPAKESSRREGLWVTEAYIASGDTPEPRAESWRRVLAEVKKGIPGVRVFFAYRFHPAGGPGGLDWQIPIEAQVPIGRP